MRNNAGSQNAPSVDVTIKESQRWHPSQQTVSVSHGFRSRFSEAPKTGGSWHHVGRPDAMTQKNLGSGLDSAKTWASGVRKRRTQTQTGTPNGPNHAFKAFSSLKSLQNSTTASCAFGAAQGVRPPKAAAAPCLTPQAQEPEKERNKKHTGSESKAEQSPEFANVLYTCPIFLQPCHKKNTSTAWCPFQHLMCFSGCPVNKQTHSRSDS